MFKRFSRRFLSLGFVTALGCGGTTETEPITLSALPSPVVKAAQKKWTDVSFDSATKETNGKKVTFVITGKDKKGKKHEIKVSREGTVLESN